MGESAQAAPSRRPVLLATKLNVPGLRPDLVPRPRLARRLDAVRDRGLVLVCAPAGYGKTVLLTEWVRRARRAVAWLSLDAGDDDPARFWRYVIAALDRVRPGAGDRLAPLLGPPPPPSFEPLVTALINDVAGESAAAEPLVLVLDDYHVIGSPLVHESLGFLLEHRPPELVVAMTSRADPPLGLARLRGRGELDELRAADLRFTPGEAAALLAQVLAVPDTVAPGAPLPDATAAALTARTEGWAAGLQLAGLSMRGHDDVEGFVAAFTGSHRFVLDYLAEEVLDRQGERLRTFLLETSVLERLSAQLCDAVTGRPGSQALLERAERSGLFVVALDQQRGWWRYHHLFADLLRVRLQQEQPGRVRALHRNAAAWFADRGLADDAVRHALAAGDATWSARLVEQHFDAIFQQGESATVRRWIAALPPELAGSRPRLLLAQAWMALVGGDVDAVGAPLDVAERALDADDEPAEPSVGRAASLLAHVPAAVGLARAYLAVLHGDAAGAAASATRALAELGDGDRALHAVGRWMLALAGWLDGRLDDAERGLAAGVAGWSAVGQRSLAAWACHDLARVRLAQGRLDAARAAYRRAIEITAPPGQVPMPAAGIGYVGLAGIAYQRDELDAARRLLAEGIPLCRQLNWTQPLAAGLVTQAWLRQADVDPAGARRAMAEAERIAPDPATTGLLNPVPVQRARLLLAQGRVAAAARWTEEGGLVAGDGPDYAREAGRLVLARVLLAQRRPGAALALLDQLAAAASAQGRTGALIEIGALRALALAAAGDADRAADALAGTLAAAAPHGHVRVLVDEGEPMADVLARLAGRRSGGTVAGVPPGYLARLQAAFGARTTGPKPGRGGGTAVPGLVEQLTGRELEVLEMVAAGRSNPAIAGQLVVTLDTVKKHVSHVLGKLGAANRTEAVARARELGLLR